MQIFTTESECLSGGNMHKSMCFKLQRKALLFFTLFLKKKIMNNTMLLLGAAAIAFFYFLGKSVMDLNRLIFHIAGVRGVSAGQGVVTIQIDILIQNPTRSTFPLYDTVLQTDILINNFAIGKAETQINALLVPGEQIMIPLTVNLNASNFAGGVAALLASVQSGNTRVDILGTVNVKGVALPLNLRYG